MGNYMVIIDHLHYLMKTVSKTKHFLISWILKEKGKISYSAGENICSSFVI